MPPSHHVTFPLTRKSALSRLQSFLPMAGPGYARMRSLDRGQDGHVHVSRLSAALRRRLISEEEVVAAVLAYHGPVAGGKLISEVFWRTYWKGWLEQRPSIWASYLQAVFRAQMRLDADSGLACRCAYAYRALSGIDCFDSWVTELKSTGYLHNWARMQFASIWIFTLGLPWELGAAFMFDHLSDADPASNTLSWRWVAGLHTKGKAYLANAERIHDMTGGRFAPRGLASSAIISVDSIDVPPASPTRNVRRPELSSPTMFLLTVEDLSLETLPELGTLNVCALAVLPGKTAADGMSLDDALSRAKSNWPDAAVLGSVNFEVFYDARALGCRQVATGFAPVGPTADQLEILRQQASNAGLLFCEYLRNWDGRAWPYCRKGFFALKEKIPTLVNAESYRL